MDLDIVKDQALIEEDKAKERRNLNYKNMFFLFMFGSLLGTILEGFFTLFYYGHWESHVICMWGPFCIIYGLGAVAFYIINVLLKNKNILIKFLVCSLSCTIIELVSGLILEFMMGMRAWNYSSNFLNFRGHICLSASLIWGALGIIFGFAIKYLDKVFDKMNHKFWKITSILLTIFMVINLSLTVVAMVRWHGRHNQIEATTDFTRYIDKIYNDEFMSDRFCEWRWLD